MESCRSQKRKTRQESLSPAKVAKPCVESTEIGLEKIIVAIDPGFKNLGWSIAEKRGEELVFLAGGVCDLCEQGDVYKPKTMVACISDFVDQLCDKLPKDTQVNWVIEQQFYNPKARALSCKLLILQGFLVGYLEGRFDCSDQVRVCMLSPSAVKKYYKLCSGDNAENKVRMLGLLRDRFGVDLKNHHIADCVLLSIYWAERND